MVVVSIGRAGASGPGAKRAAGPSASLQMQSAPLAPARLVFSRARQFKVWTAEREVMRASEAGGQQLKVGRRAMKIKSHAKSNASPLIASRRAHMPRAPARQRHRSARRHPASGRQPR